MSKPFLDSRDWRVIGQPEGTPPEAGKKYDIRHSRKGTFTATVISVSDEWADCLITDGVADAILDYNRAGVGDAVTIRACHSLFVPALTAATSPTGEQK
jgi:hypothetical protein